VTVGGRKMDVPKIEQLFFEKPEIMKKAEKKLKQKKIREEREEKITRTFHIKLRYLVYCQEHGIGKDEYGIVNINKGINILIQNGIANLERIKADAEIKMLAEIEKEGNV
jgi:hypothetical protein